MKIFNSHRFKSEMWEHVYFKVDFIKAVCVLYGCLAEKVSLHHLILGYNYSPLKIIYISHNQFQLLNHYYNTIQYKPMFEIRCTASTLGVNQQCTLLML